MAIVTASYGGGSGSVNVNGSVSVSGNASGGDDACLCFESESASDHDGVSASVLHDCASESGRCGGDVSGPELRPKNSNENWSLRLRPDRKWKYDRRERKCARRQQLPVFSVVR